jgi:hypothetical protein
MTCCVKLQYGLDARFAVASDFASVSSQKIVVAAEKSRVMQAHPAQAAVT